MSFAAAARDEMARHGQSATIKRPGSPDVSATVPVKLFDASAAAVSGAAASNARTAIVAELHLTAASWPTPPRKGDQIVVGTRIHTVMTVDTRVDGSETVLHRLTVAF